MDNKADVNENVDFQSSSCGERIPSERLYETIEIPFESYDCTSMYGKLTTPKSDGSFPVVVWVQTAESQTVDVRVLIHEGKTAEYMDLYRQCLAEMNVAFFSYDGRGVHNGSQPPRFADIDRPVFNTGTLESKVLDAIAAVEVVMNQPTIDKTQIFLMGSSEGALLAAEVATRIQGRIKGAVLHAVATELREALRFIFTEGLFMQHCLHWDADKDGIITREEFEADPKGIRRLIPGIGFEVFDRDGDGVYTIEDRRQLSKPITDALEKEEFETINTFVRGISVVDLPDGWVEDHFSHEPIWMFLSKLDIPIGLFHGEADFAAPAYAVRDLERKALEAGKMNLEFHFYPGFGHDLGAMEYFISGTLSEPFRAMFEYIKRHIKI